MSGTMTGSFYFMRIFNIRLERVYAHTYSFWAGRKDAKKISVNNSNTFKLTLVFLAVTYYPWMSKSHTHTHTHTHTKESSHHSPATPPQTWETGVNQREAKRKSMSLHLLPEVGGNFSCLADRSLRHSLPSSLPTSLRKINKHIPTCPPPPTKGLTWQGSKHNNSLVPISPDNPINQGNHKFINLYNPGARTVVWNGIDTHRHRGNLHLSFLTQHTCQALPMHSPRANRPLPSSLGKHFFFFFFW